MLRRQTPPKSGAAIRLTRSFHSVTLIFQWPCHRRTSLASARCRVRPGTLLRTGVRNARRFDCRRQAIRVAFDGLDANFRFAELVTDRIVVRAESSRCSFARAARGNRWWRSSVPHHRHKGRCRLSPPARVRASNAAAQRRSLPPERMKRRRPGSRRSRQVRSERSPRRRAGAPLSRSDRKRRLRPTDRTTGAVDRCTIHHRSS